VMNKLGGQFVKDSKINNADVIKSQFTCTNWITSDLQGHLQCQDFILKFSGI
jgi:hypothetical protein